jgi:hypothetical protein
MGADEFLSSIFPITETPTNDVNTLALHVVAIAIVMTTNTPVDIATQMFWAT